MPVPRTSKSLAERIDINYWREPHRLRRWKSILSGLAVAAALGWLGWSWAAGQQQIYQAGPLATAHTMFRNDCKQCHTETWQPFWRLVKQDDRATVADSACIRCHAGPIHHDTQIGADVPRCAQCHREHRGQTQLARVTDSFCTNCHADLKTTGEAKFVAEISSFADHPEFAWLRERRTDRAAIQFNHAVHLATGGIRSGDGQMEVLACAACHEPDAERRYMLPINYERHCSRCHANSLVFDSVRFPDRPAPHEEPEIVRGVARQRYAEYLRKHPDAAGSTENGRPVAEPGGQLPRRLPGRTPSPSSDAQYLWIAEQLASVDRVLLEAGGGCRYCHVVERTGEAWQIAPTEIPHRWLMHSQFRHDSHRMIGCTECHDNAPASTQTSHVLLPGIGSCRQCHNSRVGARTDCVECHTYHDKSRDRDFAGSLSMPSPE